MPISLPFSIDKSTAKDALRLALQSAVAAVVTYILMKTIGLPETFLAILSAVLIVEPSVGNTFNQAVGRVLATLVGSAIGFACVTLLPGSIGTAISLIIVMFIMNFVAGIKPDWRYGVVAALAIALGSESNALDTSLDRVIAILLGVSVGVVVSLTIWPDKAENRALRHLRSALTAASKRFEIAIENTRQEDKQNSDSVQGSYYQKIDLAERAAAAIRFNKKGAETIKKQIQLTKNLYNSILIIHRVSEHSNSDVSDGEAGIEKDSEKLKDFACHITKTMANKDKIEQQDLDKLDKLADTVQKNVQNSNDNKSVNALRHTFVFGMLEIRDSIKDLVSTFHDEV